jgi:hypothetical protein
MKHLLNSAAISIAAMLITLLMAFGFAHRGVVGKLVHPLGLALPDQAPHSHPALFAAECPALPHAVSPRPTHSVKAVIRT